MANKTILLIDDHSLFRSGLRALISHSLTSVEIVESDSLEDALRVQNPVLALILLDVKLQGLNGLEGAILLKRKWPETPIIVISADNSLETLQLAQEKGARYFIPKTSSADDILRIITKALNEPETQLTKVPKEFGLKSTSHKQLLTPRQYEVLDLVCKGLSNKMIARQLDLSENTVRCHVQVLLAALNASNRAEAAFTARRMGLIA
ncbi:response regulator transcription factor [Undibacterium amnicola]|uniref:Response regulator transcription factor n=1 Tax=Undibacterium amnicola TaxID=1834038 RepID=A0ABR6XRY2_9BURK|nr:response regulator transcription factor [Undibacterium amnicola]MBC3832163.1 response regulator transcription factor [Undibacterium amnicola]